MTSTESNIPTTGHWPCTNEEYHALKTHIGSSMLKTFIKSVPAYYDKYVREDAVSEPPTPSMVLGTALHAAVLEPGAFDSLIAVQPVADGRTKEGKAIKAEFEANANGKTIITAEQGEAVQAMTNNINSHREASSWLMDTSDFEHTILWEDDITELLCKARFDALGKLGDGTPFIVDLKTAADPYPDAWPRAAFNLGYHFQAAWYLEGARQAGFAGCQFIYIVVGNAAPYEVVVYEASNEWIDYGHHINTHALRGLAERMAANDWVSLYNDGVVELKPPAWAL